MTTPEVQIQNPNPAETTGPSPAATPVAAPPRARIPMSVPRQKTQVPPIPGFYTYWFLESSIPEAIQAGYTMVHKDEVQPNQHNPGNSSDTSGNIDLGTAVKLYAGVGPDGRPEFFYLMKLRWEYYLEDQRAIAERNAKILEAIFKREQIFHHEQTSQEDRNQAYIRGDMTSAHIPLFQRKPRKV